MSLTVPSAPIIVVLDQVNEPDTSRPWVARLVILSCNASYQLLPDMFQRVLMPLFPVVPLNWGNGRNAWMVSWFSGKFAYGAVTPRACAAGLVHGEVRMARSSALVMSKPASLIRPIVIAFCWTMLSDC